MATRVQPQLMIKEFSAAADISAYQYRFMEWSTTVTVTNAITDIPVGVLQNKPTAAGMTAEVLVLGGTKLVAGEAVAAGDLLGCDAEGRAIPVVAGSDTTAYILGRALTAATGAGLIISAIVNCISPPRAA